ncbi:hypothetical protein MRB53_013598 [Persea americana]|uniref:Uncharacterized protein n=1 Tax=Persea americana TaxID=3435 RepID=A0ACC2K8H6_PERAE|nr:hypothetical protein MRB53_013598 [Persea americana]
MNSSSNSKALMNSGKRQISKSTLPAPSCPGYYVTLPSNLLPQPERIATGLQQPKSFPYMLNLGEPVIITFHLSNLLGRSTTGAFTHASKVLRTAASVWAATGWCTSHAAHPRSCERSWAVVDVEAAPCVQLPKK